MWQQQPGWLLDPGPRTLSGRWVSALLKGVRIFAVLGLTLAGKLGVDLACTTLEISGCYRDK